MPRVLWPLHHHQPSVQVILSPTPPGRPMTRVLLADTGAGSQKARFELILEELDCLLGGGLPHPTISLGGAYNGSFPTYDLPISIPALGFNRIVRVVGVPSAPAGFDGIACFRFLSRFTYGNFGDPSQFGLET